MDKARTVLVIFLMLVLLVGLIFFALGYFKPQSSAVSIESSPISTVYINGEAVGKTPYQADLKSGDIALKMIPDGADNPLAGYETKITLSPGVKTIVRRTFGAGDSVSSGEIISFEKTSDATASLSIISDPDAAQISIDGTVRGFTPIKISKITPGEHQLVIAAPNFVSKNFNINAVDGYKLTVISKLAENTRPSPTPAPVLGSEKITQEVTILTTPNGYLNVRRDPSASSLLLGRVTPGLVYELVNTDAKTGWYQIKYDGEKVGWISNRYATIKNPDNQTNP